MTTLQKEHLEAEIAAIKIEVKVKKTWLILLKELIIGVRQTTGFFSNLSRRKDRWFRLIIILSFLSFICITVAYVLHRTY